MERSHTTQKNNVLPHLFILLDASQSMEKNKTAAIYALMLCVIRMALQTEGIIRVKILLFSDFASIPSNEMNKNVYTFDIDITKIEKPQHDDGLMLLYQFLVENYKCTTEKTALVKAVVLMGKYALSTEFDKNRSKFIVVSGSEDNDSQNNLRDYLEIYNGFKNTNEYKLLMGILLVVADSNVLSSVTGVLGVESNKSLAFDHPDNVTCDPRENGCETRISFVTISNALVWATLPPTSENETVLTEKSTKINSRIPDEYENWLFDVRMPFVANAILEREFSESWEEWLGKENSGNTLSNKSRAADNKHPMLKNKDEARPVFFGRCFPRKMGLLKDFYKKNASMRNEIREQYVKQQI